MIVRDFQSVIGRRPASSSWNGSTGCPTRWSPAWAGDRTRRASSIRSSRTPRSSLSAQRPEDGDEGRRPCLQPDPGQAGVLHGSFSYVLRDDDGQTQDVHSISAGLDYPGV